MSINALDKYNFEQSMLYTCTYLTTNSMNGVFRSYK